MRTLPTRIIRRRKNTPADRAFFKKESQEPAFFAEPAHETFFHPAASSVQRKCQECEKEEKVQRVTDQEEKEKNLQRMPEKKEEENENLRRKSEAAEGKKLLAHELTPIVQHGNGGRLNKKTGSPDDCADYESDEIRWSRDQKGLLSPDVVQVANDGLLISDFGVDWRHVKKAVLKDPLLTNTLETFEKDKAYTNFDIIGYSDCVGNERKNAFLRRGRAKNVAALFGKDAKTRIRSVSAAEPNTYLTGNNDSAGRATNRSVLIRSSMNFVIAEREGEKITGTDCRNAAPVTNINDYIHLVGCLETAFPQHSTREILSLLRQLYYSGNEWSRVITCGLNLGDPGSVIGTGLRDALTKSKVVSGKDMGHVLTGLEAMVCPTDDVTITKSGVDIRIKVPNEEFATWAGDLGSAAAKKTFDEATGGSRQGWRKYFGTAGSEASYEDLRADIDSYVIRAGLLGLDCGQSGGKAITGLSGARPISELLHEYYKGTGIGQNKVTADQRYACFVKALGADVASGNITGDLIAFKERIRVKTFRFAEVWLKKLYGLRGAAGLKSQGTGALLVKYSEQATNYFVNFLRSEVAKEYAKNRRP
ncbi:MAG: hypothetical protein PHI28_07615 [Mangrovibacterium sp.]|nr:hypothetical protein [Mangrovibacterium sp.]